MQSNKNTPDNVAIVCIGSNAADGAERIDAAAAMLASLGTIAAQTQAYPSPAEYGWESAPYVNKIVVLRTVDTLARVEKATKAYQEEVRAEAACKPLVAIDIDIVVWNGAVQRPADFRARYFRTGMQLLYLDEGPQQTGDTTAAEPGIEVGKA